MFRALTSYFFGGPTDDQSSCELECETKEVNDWLVVNMPDRLTDDVDFEEVDPADALEEDVDDEDIDEEDIYDEDIYDEDDEDDDDVLSSLSILMTPSTPVVEPPLLQRWGPRHHQLPIVIEDYFSAEFQRVRELTDMCKKIVANWPRRRSYKVERKNHFDGLEELSAGTEFGSEEPMVLPLSRYATINRLPSRLNKKPVVRSHLTVTDCQTGTKLKERKVLEVKAKKEPTCHPAFTNTFCNHRHLTFPPKTDVLDRIKELEPEQRAKDQALRKHVTRGQLNRQNKNYIYEKSSKKNRRSHLQRKPSGANNNRKC